MPSPFFPVDPPSGAIAEVPCGGPTRVGMSTARASKKVLGVTGDEEIPKAEDEELDEAERKALQEAIAAMRAFRSMCPDKCKIPELVITLSDYRVKDETGPQVASGLIGSTYEHTVSAEVDWTVQIYCQPAPAEIQDPPAEQLTNQGCVTRSKSSTATGKGESGQPNPSAVQAETQAKGRTIDDLTNGVTSNLKTIRCDKCCKKQKTVIRLSNFSVASHEAQFPLGKGFAADTSFHWTATANCKEP
jgi:hypothetical protein